VLLVFLASTGGITDVWRILIDQRFKKSKL